MSLLGAGPTFTVGTDPDEERYGWLLNNGSDVVALKNLSMLECRAFEAAIDVNTNSMPGVIDSLEIDAAGFAPPGQVAFNMADSNLTAANRVNVFENDNGSGDLYGSEIDPDGVLFWENPEPLVLTTSDSLPAGLAENLFLYDFIGAGEISGGNAPWKWSLGSAPAFLSIGVNSGLLSGTPTRQDVGVHQFSVTVVDSSFPVPETLTKVFSLRVENLTEIPLVIATDAIDSATINRAYGFSMLASGGQGGARLWSISNTNQALPLGLTMTANGVISGTPDASAQGTHTVTFVVEELDANNLPTGIRSEKTLDFTVFSEAAQGGSEAVTELLADKNDGGCAVSGSSSSSLIWVFALLAMVGIIRRRQQA